MLLLYIWLEFEITSTNCFRERSQSGCSKFERTISNIRQSAEGVLRTWQAIKVTNFVKWRQSYGAAHAAPKAKFALMEELLQKQQAGTLAEYVRDGMKGCK